MAFTQIGVTGHYQLPDGTPVDGTVTFTPTTAMTNVDGDTEVSVAAPVVGPIVGGTLTASLAASDDEGTTPEGVTYRVEVRSYRHTGLMEPVWWLTVPAGGGAIDLATVEKQYVTPRAAPYLTRQAADGLYAPIVAETVVDYDASFAPSTSLALSQAMVCTGDVTVLVPTGPTDAVLRLALLASGAERQVTFSTGIRVTTGIERGPHAVPAGEVLLAALQYSALVSDWVLTALTVTEA